MAVPVTLALTLLLYYLYGYTLNRVTLFALIFSIGILVDDAIVVVENISRHFHLPENHGRPLVRVAVEAVAEVGNPTILATLGVIAAILPMAFVGGLMGPYMRPIPVGASVAMLFSLFIAFIISPWAAYRMLKGEKTAAHTEGHEDWTTRLYRGHDDAADPLRLEALGLSGRRRRAAAGRRVAGLFRARARQDAPLRQQERVPGDRGHARGDHPGADGARHARDRAVPGDGARGDGLPDVRRHRLAVQLQRPGPPLLPAPGAPPGRPAGEPPAQGRAPHPEPRHRQARAARHPGDRRAVRRPRQGGGGPPGPAGPADPGGRGVRAGLRPADRGRARHQGALRQDARRGGRGLVRGGSAAPRPLRGGSGEGGAERRHRRAGGRRPCGWPSAGRRSVWPTSRRRRRTSRSSCACPARSGPAPRPSPSSTSSAAGGRLVPAARDRPARGEPRRAQHLPEEHEAGGVRDRRRGGRGREPGLRHLPDEPRPGRHAAPRGLPPDALLVRSSRSAPTR